MKLPIHGPRCGLTQEEIAKCIEEIDYYIFSIQHLHPSAVSYAKEVTVFKQIMMYGNGNDVVHPPQLTVFPDAPAVPAPGILKRLFNLIIRIKASENYNEAIGYDLGIIPLAKNSEMSIPVFKVKVEQGIDRSKVRIDFKKYGHDGVWIESRINEGDWFFLATYTVKPYFDERPLSAGNVHETREYRLRWWDKSEPVGEWSSVQKVIVGL